MNVIRKKISAIQWDQLTPEQRKNYIEKHADD